MLRNLKYVQCLNIAAMENTWFIAPVEKTWFCEKLFFEVVIVMVKDKKIQYKRYNAHEN